MAIRELPDPVDSYGILLRETRDHVTLAMSKSGKQVNQTKVIPKAWMRVNPLTGLKITPMEPSGGSSGSAGTRRRPRATTTPTKPEPTTPDSAIS